MKKVLCDPSFIGDNAMWNGVLRVVHLKIYFLIRFWSDHNEISMANANIAALYVGSLRSRISHFFSELFYIVQVVRN